MIRIVLADDHATIRRAVARLLGKQQNIDVIGEAENGEKALELVNELKPDILILDIEMPVMNGIEVARTMQETESRTRIIILSNYNDLQMAAELWLLGARGYVVKDDAPFTLVEAVNFVCNNDSRWTSPSLIQ